jgi:hypothetical protein
MTRLQSLIALRDAVKGGECPLRLLKDAGFTIDMMKLARSATYDDDMNAVLSLLPGVLPGWRVRLDIGRRNRAWVISPENQKLDEYADIPARALLLAILSALIAQEGGE